jgi:hypothetical protein
VQAGLTGTGECDFFGADGVLANEHFDTLTSILEAEQAQVCHGAELPHQRWRSPRAVDLQGQAEPAEIAWLAVAALLEL